jgi:hypothetical protein
VVVLYNHFIDQVIALYPNPKGVLQRNLIINMQYFYGVFEATCEERFPYGTLQLAGYPKSMLLTMMSTSISLHRLLLLVLTVRRLTVVMRILTRCLNPPSDTT